RYFRPILEKAGLPRIRLYDLRHSCATLLLMADEHPKVVSERLGHSTIVLTLDTYSHVLPTMQQQATARLESLLYDESGTPKIVNK
ncbi:MAG TPA: tyrosine-type recombinase/integrase, partial [Pyrinomonadaceae bacterium]